MYNCFSQYLLTTPFVVEGFRLIMSCPLTGFDTMPKISIIYRCPGNKRFIMYCLTEIVKLLLQLLSEEPSRYQHVYHLVIIEYWLAYVCSTLKEDVVVLSISKIILGDNGSKICIQCQSRNKKLYKILVKH